MVKKGKFELFSYFREECLIFYRSKNNNEKIVAFSSILIDSIFPIFSKLTNFLNSRLIDSFSYQIQKDKKDLLVFCFKDTKKSNILKCFHIICEKTLENDSVKLLRNKSLEDFFFNSLIDPLEPKLRLEKSANSLLIKNNEIQYNLFCFTLNINIIKEGVESLLNNLLNVVKNLTQKGFFLFHFKMVENKIVFFPIFIEILNGDSKNSFNGHKINNFFNCKLLESYPLNVKHFGSLIWRLPITENFFYLKDFDEIFKKKESSTPFQIEKKLIKKNLNFIKINDQIFLIEKRILLITLTHMNPVLIKNLIERYYGKYFILIILLKKKDYLNLKKEIKNINSLKNLVVMNKEEFKKLNYNFREFS